MSSNDHNPDDKKPTPPPIPPTKPIANDDDLPPLDLGSEAEIDLGDLDVTAAGSSAVPLADLPEPPSGPSLTTWSAVVRRQREAQQAADAQPAGEVRVDAPSDKDILDHLPAAPKPSGDTSEIPEADLPVFTPPSESDVDLGQGTAREAGGSASDVAFNILNPPSDAAGPMPRPAAAEEDSEAIPFGLAPGTGMSGAISGVDLGADPETAGEAGRSSILDVLLRESAGAGLVSDEPPPASAPPAPPAAEPAFGSGDEDPTELELSLPDSGFGEDGQVDLLSDVHARPPSLTDSGTLEISDAAIAEAQRRADQMESSAVDLGSRPGRSSSEFEMHMQPDADIDMDLPPPPDDGDSSLIRRGLAEVQEAETRPAPALAEGTDDEVVEADEGEEPPARPARRPAAERPERSGGKMMPLALGTAIGLLIGGGGLAGAYFGGLLPDRTPASMTPPPDRTAELAQARQQTEAAKKEAEETKAAGEAFKKSLVDAGIDPENPGEKVQLLTKARDQATGRVSQLGEMLTAANKAAEEAKTAEDAAKKAQADAEKAATDAKKQLADAEKALTDAMKQTTDALKAADTAKADALAAKKAADEAADQVAKALKGAGVEAAKPDEGIKKLAEAKAAAEAKEKDAAAKLAESVKKEADLAKAVDAAKKAADDAAKARDASQATVKAVGDKLAKAKFVANPMDPAAVVKGLDDALKVAASDATATLRDELAKARQQETKMAADLAAARQKEAAAAKEAAAVKAEAQKLQDEVKVVNQKMATDAAKAKAEAGRLSKEAADAAAKATEATRVAAEAKADADQQAAEAARLKAENDRMARDLEGVKEVAAMVRTPAASTAGPPPKPDPVRLAERYYDVGLNAFHAGRSAEAAEAFRKAIHYQPDDARFHYLLGLALWQASDTKGAEAAFEKGRDLELAGKPSSRAVGAALERIQGPARQAVNAHRP